jgi:redox-sensing transcriptional repressor
MQAKEISLPTLRRLPVYLHYLNSIKDERKNISATAIAAYFGINDVQVRKDLGVVSGTGRPKTGYVTEELIKQIQDCLCCKTDSKAVLVGAGNIGKALLSYSGFSDFGLKIVAAFDTDSRLMGTYINGKPIYSVSELERVCSEQSISLGIIAVPVDYAQSICDKLVSSGIRAIWNFAPAILKKPDGVLIENENLASSLAILSRHLGETTDK